MGWWALLMRSIPSWFSVRTHRASILEARSLMPSNPPRRGVAQWQSSCMPGKPGASSQDLSLGRNNHSGPRGGTGRDIAGTAGTPQPLSPDKAAESGHGAAPAPTVGTEALLTAAASRSGRTDSDLWRPEKKTWRFSARAEGAGSLPSRRQARHKEHGTGHTPFPEQRRGRLFTYYLCPVLIPSSGGGTLGVQACNAPPHQRALGLVTGGVRRDGRA